MNGKRIRQLKWLAHRKWLKRSSAVSRLLSALVHDGFRVTVFSSRDGEYFVTAECSRRWIGVTAKHRTLYSALKEVASRVYSHKHIMGDVE